MEWRSSSVWKSLALVLLMTSGLICSCRKIAPEENGLALWQNDWQGIPLTAISHSKGLNLFLPPAPVFFASTRTDAVPPPQIHWNDLGPASDALEDYCQAWSTILQQRLPPAIDLPAAFTLPMPPWMTAVRQEDFQSTVKFLYQALEKDELNPEQKKQLEILILFQEQQRQLASVLNFVDKINRGQDCDLNAALRQFRIFQEFQQEFAGKLQENLLPDLLLPAHMVEEMLLPLLKLPQLETALHCLPSLWMAIRETENSPLSATGKSLQDWRNLKPEPFRFAAIWEDLQKGSSQTADGFTWLIMSFPSPQPETKTAFYLIFLPLPEQTEVFLNGISQACTTGQPFALNVKTAESPEDEQLLALRFHNSNLGSPLWAPWLVKAKIP